MLIILVGFIYENQLKIKKNSNIQPQNTSAQNSLSDAINSSINNSPDVQSSSISVSSFGFVSPVERASERVTKKPFGIYITPKTSPVSPEKFQGYHTGTDFEIFPSELNQDVSVGAICNGKIKIKEWASGYGGVMIEDCNYNKQPITVIYGHLNLSSIIKKVGDRLNTGDQIGILGNDKSQQTDGERKHLHLGIHKGSSANILGYVQTQSQLDGWYNPCDLGVCR